MENPAVQDLEITITGINNGSLTLSDNGVSIVKPGAKVSWIIGQNSGVASINGITDDSAPIDIFSSDPRPVANSSRWQAIVNPNITAATEEYYTIMYTADNDENTYTFDPKIAVNP